ncbi:MAG: hypothetical protein IPN67_20685 [Bacteroidales bacterium]|nr:hypothetical protein [Bacteroidales bacterium]
MKKIILLLTSVLTSACLSGQGKLIDVRDGNTYSTITIQGVTWMAENLKFKPNTGAYFFDHNSDNLPCYGFLYEWKTALNVCPSGWHLPSGSEFQTLANHFEHGDTWKKLPSDPTSFAIQLGGMQDYEGTFSEMDESAYYWTSTEYDNINAEYFSYLMISNKPVIDISRKEDIPEIPGTEKSNKYSVRCIRN